MRATKYMSRTTRFQILVVLRLPTFDSNFATLNRHGYIIFHNITVYYLDIPSIVICLSREYLTFHLPTCDAEDVDGKGAGLTDLPFQKGLSESILASLSFSFITLAGFIGLLSVISTSHSEPLCKTSLRLFKQAFFFSDLWTNTWRWLGRWCFGGGDAFASGLISSKPSSELE